MNCKSYHPGIDPGSLDIFYNTTCVFLDKPTQFSYMLHTLFFIHHSSFLTPDLSTFRYSNKN